MRSILLVVISALLFAPVADIRSASSSRHPIRAGGNHVFRQSAPFSQPIPDYRAYELFFKRVISMDNEEASRANAATQSGSFRALQAELSLTENQASFLRNLAYDAISQSKSLDVQARAIINAARAKYPNGHFDSRYGRPRPPKELAQMQLSRDSVFLQAEDSIRGCLGEQTFSQFEQSVARIIKGNLVTAIPQKLPAP